RGQRPKTHSWEVSLKLGRTVPCHPHLPRRHLHSSHDGPPSASSNVAHLKPKEIIHIKHRAEVNRAVNSQHKANR
ncbi:hypothetical protein BHM03_00033248, partial [Ensete ventricosum]